MGGGSYSRDVGRSFSSEGFNYGSTSSEESHIALSRRESHRDTLPYNRSIRSNRQSPIVFLLDDTSSNIEFARIFYDKVPMLHGQIEQQNILGDFELNVSLIGDIYSDHVPLQVGNFKYGGALDNEIKKLWLEGGGGPGQKESYEFGAYYFANKCEMPNANMPFMFFVGDEAPYPKLDAAKVGSILGINIAQDIPSNQVFHDLYNKFQGNVFFLQNAYFGRRNDDSYTPKVKDRWIDYIGQENVHKIITINQEKSVIDVSLGVIALVSKKRTLEEYKENMRSREQSEDRINLVEQSLRDLESKLLSSQERIISPSLPINKRDIYIHKSGGEIFE